MAFKFLRYSHHIRWFALQTKINENYNGGTGHFFPRKAIVSVFLGENIGFEKSGLRPSVVVSTDANNKFSGNIAVVPLTKIDNKKKDANKFRLLKSQYILRQANYKLKFDSIVQCEDIRIISKARVGDVFDFVQTSDMKEIERRLKYFLDLK